MTHPNTANSALKMRRRIIVPSLGLPACGPPEMSPISTVLTLMQVGDTCQAGDLGPAPRWNTEHGARTLVILWPNASNFRFRCQAPQRGRNPIAQGNALGTRCQKTSKP